MKNLKLFGLLTVIFSLVACSSDNSIECAEYTGELTAIETPLVGTWSLSAITSDVAVDLTNDNVDNESMDIYAQYSDCQNDAIYNFGADRVYSFKQGLVATNCVEAETFNRSGTWKFSANNLMITDTCSEFNINITLDAGETVFTFENNVTVIDANNLSIPAKFTYTYTKI